jgi:radical SAM superfamily enzyme YgiQ (UPF0313 family)
MRGMRRIWQGAGTVNSLLASGTEPRLLEKAAASGLRSLFVGFESTDQEALRAQRKFQNLNRDYTEAIRRLHGLGIMVNGSFVFGMDQDGPDVFERTVEWAIAQGIETATFHILTPYPGTPLYRRMREQGRLLHSNWDLYDTRHTVFRPARMSPEQLEAGYWRAYRDFYRWGAIARGALAKETWAASARHFAYAAGWKKFEPLWDLVLRARRVAYMRPLLERVLQGSARQRATPGTASPALSDPSSMGFKVLSP